MDNQSLFALAQAQLGDCGHRLLYLSKFGSTLYGTATPNSDIDVKGIFLPNLRDVLLNRVPKTIKFSTGNDQSKNTKEDIDLELYSLHYWMLNLLATGESTSLDILFSHTNRDCIIYMSSEMKSLMFYNDIYKVFNSKEMKGYLGFAIAQARRYGVRGARLNVIRLCYEFLQSYLKKNVFNTDERLSTILHEMWLAVTNGEENEYCFIKTINGANGVPQEGLCLCGKMYMDHMRLGELLVRLRTSFEEYGERSKAAETNQGIDWKSVSHALRSIYQMQSLLTLGKVIFPLKEAELVKSVKLGEFTWEEVNNMIVEGLNTVEVLQTRSSFCGVRDDNFIEEFVLKMYR